MKQQLTQFFLVHYAAFRAHVSRSTILTYLNAAVQALAACAELHFALTRHVWLAAGQCFRLILLDAYSPPSASNAAGWSAEQPSQREKNVGAKQP